MIQTVVEVELPVEERLRIQKNRIEPDAGSNGRRISIVTGIHGDELEGQYVCFAVQQRLRRHPEYLRGTVDIYPAMNPLGIDSVTRGIICGRKYYGHISRIVKSEDFLSLRAERAGFFQPFVRPGEQVVEGQRLAVISGPLLGEPLSTITTPADGAAFVQDEPMCYQHTAVIKLIGEEQP